MDETADIYLIAVSDKIIHEVVNYMPKNNKLILHTAGSVSINVLFELVVVKSLGNEVSKPSIRDRDISTN